MCVGGGKDNEVLQFDPEDLAWPNWRSRDMFMCGHMMHDSTWSQNRIIAQHVCDLVVVSGVNNNTWLLNYNYLYNIWSYEGRNRRYKLLIYKYRQCGSFLCNTHDTYLYRSLCLVTNGFSAHVEFPDVIGTCKFCTVWWPTEITFTHLWQQNPVPEA